LGKIKNFPTLGPDPDVEPGDIPVAGGPIRLLSGVPADYEKYKILKVLPVITLLLFIGVIPLRIFHFDKKFFPICIETQNLSYWNIPEYTYFEAVEICEGNPGEALINSSTVPIGSIRATSKTVRIFYTLFYKKTLKFLH